MNKLALTESKPSKAVAAPQAVAMTPMEMLSHALTNGVAAETLDKLMALQERWSAGQARKAFDEAIAAAKAKIPVISKNRKVDYTTKDQGRVSYDHEDLGVIAETVNPILAEQGLSYRYRSAQQGDRVSVTCIVTHRDGHFEETTLEANSDTSGKKNPIQAVGSTITYLQRYTLKLALGLAAAKDDDGKASEAPATVTVDQVAELEALMEALDATDNDRDLFCDWLKVKTLADIPASKFDLARKTLDEKRLNIARAAKAKEASNGNR